MIASGITTVQHIHGWMPGGYEAIHGAASKVLGAYRALGMRASYCYAVREQNRLVYEADEDFCARLPAELGEKLARHLKAQAMPFDDFLKLFDSSSRRERRPGASPASSWRRRTCTGARMRGFRRSTPRRRRPACRCTCICWRRSTRRNVPRRRNGKTALRHLHDLGVLGPHMTLWPRRGLAERGGYRHRRWKHRHPHLPQLLLQLRLRSGLAPLNRWEAKGINVGMGLDEARHQRRPRHALRAALSRCSTSIACRRAWRRTRTCRLCPQVVRDGDRAGAATTAFGASIGRLDEGRFFDAALINWTKATYPLQDPDIPMLDALVQRAKTGAVDAVFVNGEVVYEDGRFTKGGSRCGAGGDRRYAGHDAQRRGGRPSRTWPRRVPLM